MKTEQSRQLKIQNLLLDYYVEGLRSDKPFTFVRYGDGEFRVIHQVHEANRVRCSGAEAYPQYAADLRTTLDEPRACHRGLQGMAVRTAPHLIEPWADLEWVDSDVLHHANIKGQLYPFVEQIQRMRTCMIGPDYLKGLDFLQINWHIDTEKRHCYLQKEALLEQLQEIDKKQQPDIYLFSASGLTNILIWRLLPLYGGKRFMIDCGSMWEPYVGKSIRRYHRVITQDTLRKNRSG